MKLYAICRLDGDQQRWVVAVDDVEQAFFWDEDKAHDTLEWFLMSDGIMPVIGDDYLLNGVCWDVREYDMPAPDVHVAGQHVAGPG